MPRAPLGDMPLINQSFQIVTKDLVGPIAPANDKEQVHPDLDKLCNKLPRSCFAEKHRYRDGSRSVVRHVQSH